MPEVKVREGKMPHLSFVPYHPWQAGELAPRVMRMGDLAMSLLVVTLGRAGPASHLGSSLGLALSNGYG